MASYPNTCKKKLTGIYLHLPDHGDRVVWTDRSVRLLVNTATSRRHSLLDQL